MKCELVYDELVNIFIS